MKTANRSEVTEFLNLFKGCVNLQRYSIRDRDKNIQTLIDLGINPNERIEIMLSLVPEDYVKGPEPDKMESDKEVWIFGKKHSGGEIYIKLRVVEDTKHRGFRALVWSFHPAEKKMHYPLAK
jgi:hypothetical protein